MTLFWLTLVAIALVMAFMAVGVLLSNRELRGSCGGPAVLDSDGVPITCGDCGCKAVDAETGEAEPASRAA